MSSAQYQYQTPTLPNKQTTNAGDYLSDLFLGTTNLQQKENINNALMNYQFNLATLNEQNRFNEYMANTAYQRSIDDMTKAGINPTILYSNSGASARSSTPSSASMGSSQVANTQRGFGLIGQQIGKVVNNMLSNINGDNKQYASGIIKALLG